MYIEIIFLGFFLTAIPLSKGRKFWLRLNLSVSVMLIVQTFLSLSIYNFCHIPNLPFRVLVCSQLPYSAFFHYIFNNYSHLLPNFSNIFCNKSGEMPLSVNCSSMSSNLAAFLMVAMLKEWKYVYFNGESKRQAFFSILLFFVFSTLVSALHS